MGNVGIVQTAYDSFATGDSPEIVELMDASVEWSSPMTLPQGGQFSGTAGAIQFFQGLGASWESLGLAVESLGEATPGTVVAVVSLSGEILEFSAATRRGGNGKVQDHRGDEGCGSPGRLRKLRCSADDGERPIASGQEHSPRRTDQALPRTERHGRTTSAAAGHQRRSL